MSLVKKAVESDLIEVSLGNKIADSKTPTVCVDLDGTLLVYDGWKGEDHFGKPIQGAKEAMIRFKDLGYRIIIFTTRGNIAAIKNYLKEKEIPFDYINENPDQPEGSNKGKPIADVYIDDRAIQFIDWNQATRDTEKTISLEKKAFNVLLAENAVENTVKTLLNKAKGSLFDKFPAQYKYGRIAMKKVLREAKEIDSVGQRNYSMLRHVGLSPFNPKNPTSYLTTVVDTIAGFPGSGLTATAMGSSYAVPTLATYSAQKLLAKYPKTQKPLETGIQLIRGLNL